MASADFKHATIQANGINIHTVECGDAAAPLVLFVHGFPESWYSWRHQMPVVAAAGFRAVAYDGRGYGKTDKPESVDEYTLSSLMGDTVGIVEALGYKTAIIVGHDWGAPIAYFSALVRPDVFSACAILSVPYLPPAFWSPPMGMTMNDVMRHQAGDREYYRLFFQPPGVAEADLEADIEKSVLGFLYLISGDIVANGDHTTPFDGHFPKDQPISSQFIIPKTLPPWLTKEDLDFYVGEFKQSGYRGGVNYYRNINWIPRILAPFKNTTIKNPTCYIGGSLECVASGAHSTSIVANQPSCLQTLTSPHLTSDSSPTSSFAPADGSKPDCRKRPPHDPSNERRPPRPPLLRAHRGCGTLDPAGTQGRGEHFAAQVFERALRTLTIRSDLDGSSGSFVVILRDYRYPIIVCP